MRTATDSTVTISVSSGEANATFEVPVIAGAEAALTLCVNDIECNIRYLWHSPRGTRVCDIDAKFNEIIGQIRLITLLTGIYPCDKDQIVMYLRFAAFEAKDTALARRK